MNLSLARAPKPFNPWLRTPRFQRFGLTTQDWHLYDFFTGSGVNFYAESYGMSLPAYALLGVLCSPATDAFHDERPFSLPGRKIPIATLLLCPERPG